MHKRCSGSVVKICCLSTLLAMCKILFVRKVLLHVYYYRIIMWLYGSSISDSLYATIYLFVFEVLMRLSERSHWMVDWHTLYVRTCIYMYMYMYIYVSQMYWVTLSLWKTSDSIIVCSIHDVYIICQGFHYTKEEASQDTCYSMFFLNL